MNNNIQITSPATFLLNTTTNISLDEDDNSTICADQLIGDALEGLSGKILWGVLQVILMVLGNIGNVLTLIVLNRRLMRKGGVNNLLQGLAISDIIAPTLACIPHIIYYYGPKTNGAVGGFVNSFILPVATGATFCSNWIVVTITSFRLMIVVKPLYSQVYCSSENERRALIVIFLFSILSIMPYYYFRSNMEVLDILKVVSAVLSLLGPWVICVILWILLIRIVSREIGPKKSNQFILHSEVVAQRLKSKSKITRMVLIICFFNIICQLPVLVLTIFSLINNNPCGYINASIFVCLLFISTLLLTVNHSVNFFIYSLTNSKFRYTLKIMCRHCCFCNDYLQKQTIKQRQITGHNDSQKRVRTQTPKLDSHARTNSIQSRESPHLLITTRIKTTSKYSLNNNQSGRVAL
ncbi:unnamed protein product [Adineta steineri]|uniref:G-protein coupled receptors family 1 profile domain-containing protein n=1 Tax=Adineta steineri TaxID=433720 RepID=A0A815J2R5_9BILA|nr:unnamed protein product [Adineta steineri]CAF3514535.1 unnamed protein product [Adineta steineri]